MKNVLVRVLSRLHWLQHFNLTVPYRRNGRTVKIPIIRSLGSENLHLSERWMCDVMERLLKLKKGAFVDIGVNLGQTLIKLKLVDDSVPYVGFDPNPVCIFYTKELIRANGYENATLVPVGLSNTNELVTLNFYADGDSDASASIVNGFRPTQKIFRKEFVACFEFAKISHALPQQEIAIVKIDVEGAELEVIAGIREMLQEKRPFVLIEILPVYSKENADRLTRQEALEKILHTVNYKILRIIKKDGEFRDLSALNSIGVNERIEDADYLLCPAEQTITLK